MSTLYKSKNLSKNLIDKFFEQLNENLDGLTIINPLTKASIKVNGPTFKKLLKKISLLDDHKKDVDNYLLNIKILENNRYKIIKDIEIFPIEIQWKILSHVNPYILIKLNNKYCKLLSNDFWLYLYNLYQFRDTYLDYKVSVRFFKNYDFLRYDIINIFLSDIYFTKYVNIFKFIKRKLNEIEVANNIKYTEDNINQYLTNPSIYKFRIDQKLIMKRCANKAISKLYYIYPLPDNYIDYVFNDMIFNLKKNKYFLNKYKI